MSSEPGSELKIEDVMELVRALFPNLTEEGVVVEAESLLRIIADVILEDQVPLEYKGVSCKTSQ